MAKLYPVKNGSRPDTTSTNIEIDRAMLKQIAEKIILKYMGQEPPQFNVESPSEYAEQLVLEIEESEDPKLKAGFYLLQDIHPRNIKDIIPEI